MGGNDLSEIVPDVVSMAPPASLSVSYGNANVNAGNTLKVSLARDVPSIKFPAQTGHLYTIAMVDPDAPSRSNPVAAQWKHWLVINVSGNDLSSGQTLTDYAGPSPPRGSGPHRYVFLAYQQKGRITSISPDNKRARFNIADFAEENNLGDPIAGNYFFAENK